MDWWQRHLEDTAQWIAQMSRHPATVDHARHRLKELMADPLHLYEGLPQRIKDILAESSASPSPCAPAAGSTTDRTGEQGQSA